jgi:hypothetical protein
MPFYRVVSGNPKMLGRMVVSVQKIEQDDKLYIQGLYADHGMKAYTWFEAPQLEPCEPPIAWFGAPVKQEQ